VIIALLMLGTNAFAQVNVTLPNVSGVAGTSASGAISVGNLTGKNVRSFQFQLSYNKKNIYITGVNTDNTLVGNNAPTVNADTAKGIIRVAWASAAALIGSGNLVNLNIIFREGGRTILNFGSPSTFIFNDGTPSVTITNGSATIAQIIVQGGSLSARVGETIKIPILVSPIKDGDNVSAYDFVGTFDKSIINITSVDLTGTLSDGGSAYINANTAGIIRVAWASSNRIINTNETTLLYLTGTAVSIGTTTLNFTSFEVNQGSPFASANPASITVKVQNYAPTLTLSPVGPNYTTSDGVQLKLILVGADQNPEDVALLDYSITAPTTLPYGVNLKGNTFTWTPTVAQRSVTPYSFSFKVKDQGGLSSTIIVNITVTQNYAPTLTLSPVGPNYKATDGVELKITLNGADQNPSDIPLLQYIVSEPSILPVGAKLIGNVFTWTPAVAQRSVTPYTFIFRVIDQGSLTAIQAASITVTQNYAPTITLNPEGPNYFVDEGVALSIILVGADKNSSDVPQLAYSITAPVSPPEGAKLKGNVFSWTPTFDEGRLLPYSFIFKVTDSFGASVYSTINITVVNVDRPPVFTKVPDYLVFPVFTPTPKTMSFQYVATDPDGDHVYYSLINGPTGSNVDTNGLFTWGPTIDQAGHIYTVTVQATDGQRSTSTTQFIAASDITDVKRLDDIPKEYSLLQNYPNPFNPTTSIQFSLPKGNFVKLAVFNILGEQIRVLVNQYMSAGNYKINFDAAKLISGLYIYRIETIDYTSVKKMLLVK